MQTFFSILRSNSLNYLWLDSISLKRPVNRFCLGNLSLDIYHVSTKCQVLF